MKASSRHVFSCLKKPVGRWPGGLFEFLKHLKDHGFEAECGFVARGIFAKKDPKTFPKAVWKSLEFARGLDSKVPNSNSYSYLSAGIKLPDSAKSFALLLVDSKANLDSLDGVWVVKTPHVAQAFDCLLKALWVEPWSARTKKSIGEKTKIAKGVVLEAGVLVGPYSEIAQGVVIEAGTRIGAHVRIGKGTRIGAHSSIGDNTVIGEHCHFHSHASIGHAGFGTLKNPNEAFSRQRIHAGKVIIGDGVRLGAFVGIDRGVLADTQVMSHCVIDNFVHIAHNVEVGEGAIVCALVAMGGSSSVGSGAVIAGLVGIKEHVSVGKGAVVGAQSGVSRNVKDNEAVKGYPPRPMKEALKIQALVDRLPDLYERIKLLEGKAK